MKKLFGLLMIGFIALLITSCQCEAANSYEDNPGGVEMVYEAPQPINITQSFVVEKIEFEIFAENTVAINEEGPEVVYIGDCTNHTNLIITEDTKCKMRIEKMGYGSINQYSIIDSQISINKTTPLQSMKTDKRGYGSINRHTLGVEIG